MVDVVTTVGSLITGWLNIGWGETNVKQTRIGMSAALMICACWPLIALSLSTHVAAQPAATTCTAADFDTAVDAAGTRLRAFNQNAMPKLQDRLNQLKTHKGWGSKASEQRAMDYLHDARIAGLDAKAGDLLAKIDDLGRSGEANPPDCSKLPELEAAGLELLAVMKAKLKYTETKISAEISGKPGTSVTASTPFGATIKNNGGNGSAAKPSDPFLEPSDAPETSAAKARPPTPADKPVPEKPAPDRIAKAPAKLAETPPDANAKTGSAKPASPRPPAPITSWPTMTERTDQPEAGTPLPPISGESEVALNDPASALRDGVITEASGYTIDEIRLATKGFFGTISTNLASVIEHAFKNWGRPTGYILGNEGGGAFLAGLRYGKGTLYPRYGEQQPIYWHGPSLGYDFGAAGSRTLILVYAMQQPSDIYRMFTGIDGSAYLVGGVGLTVLSGGSVVMTPIRSGLGLRLGANVGYLRFTSEPTWNPF